MGFYYRKAVSLGPFCVNAKNPPADTRCLSQLAAKALPLLSGCVVLQLRVCQTFKLPF